MNDRASTLAGRIYDTAHVTGTFQLRSGATSHEYFDKYRFESDPHLLAEIAEQMLQLIPPDTDALAGLELGGVPLATALALRSGLPALFVRKEAKKYGTCQLAEGGTIAGRRLTIVEDVITSGGQAVTSCRQLRDLGATVDVALCVIDRQAGGTEHLADASVQLRALMTLEQLNSAQRPT